MKETTITRQVMQNWKRQLADMLWYHKIADPTLGGDKTNERAVDVVACIKGRFVGLEWKLKKNNRGFPIKRIRINQVKTLCEIVLAGGIGLIAIAVYLGPHDKCVYLIPVQEWNKAVAAAPRLSIRIEEVFGDFCVVQHRVGSFVHWDTKLLEELTNGTV